MADDLGVVILQYRHWGSTHVTGPPVESEGIYTYMAASSIRPTRLLFPYSGYKASQKDFDPMFYSCLKLQSPLDADQESKSPSIQIILRDIQAVEMGESEHMQVAGRPLPMMSSSLDRLHELLPQS